ncbi:Nop6p [Rhodotorula paludigena]|uniref:Nop6p n=1 Tax=Rhodotorula paludigena TaxID=86838 RepID=UPI00316BD8A8
MSDAPGRKLTKKEKKAQAFRANKGKAKKVAPSFDDEVAALDDGGDESLDVLERTAAKSAKAGKESKKRKRDDEDEGAAPPDGKEDKGEQAGEGAADEQPKKKKRQRGKTQAQRDREAREAAKAGGAGGEGNHRLLLFVGNMSYTTTADEIKKHFEPCGEAPAVRLLTPKTSSDSSSKPASKGCAFLEFTSGTALQSALRLHHSTLSGRKINVELTAGGGGNSAARKAKIDEQRKKLTLEREKAAKNKRMREGEAENGDKTGRWKLAAEKQASAEGDEGSAEAGAGAAEGAADKPKKKVRDRRLKNGGGAAAGGAAAAAGGGNPKVDAAKQKRIEARAVKASSGANAIKLASGWGNRAKA